MRRQLPIPALLAACIALALLALAYSNFFHNSFHFDDDHAIVENASIRSLSNWTRFFTDAHTFSSQPSNATYRPIVTLSFALDYAVHGALDPVPFHVTQLVLLIIVGVLLSIVFTSLFGPGQELLAVIAASIFCLHTANTETMNLLSSRSELLSAIGLLAALIVFIRWPAQRRRGLYLIPLAIGALAKAPVVIFAGIVMAWVALIERRRPVDALKAALPSFIAGIALLIGLNAMNAKEWIAGGGSRLGYLITQPYAWLHYARLAILPAGLSADTDLEPMAHWYDTNAIAGYAFVVLLCLAIARFSRTREQAPVAFGLAWFGITLLPTSSIFPLAEVVNEHRLFFPLMGAAAAFVWTAELIMRRWPQAQRLAYSILVIAALALAYGTHIRNEVWRTEETLWRDVTQKSPRNGRGWMNYGLTQMEVGRYTIAKEAFDHAAQFTPSFGTLEINRGIVAAALGDHVSAEQHFRRALALHPDRNAHFYYARWLLRRGRGLEAEPHLAEAARVAPTWVPPRRLALEVAAGRGQDAKARTLAAGILQIDPTDEEARAVQRDGADLRRGTYRACFDQAWASMQNEQHAQAASGFRAAIRFEPKALAYNNLGWSLASLGFRDDAAAAYEAAIAADPQFERAKNNLRDLNASPAR
jgi:tetratricopeptide (TPR) repeat protein